MSKKHFVKLAELFRNERPRDNWDANKRVQHNLLLKGLMNILQSENPNFDRGRFLAACGGWAKE